MYKKEPNQLNTETKITNELKKRTKSTHLQLKIQFIKIKENLNSAWGSTKFQCEGGTMPRICLKPRSTFWKI